MKYAAVILVAVAMLLVVSPAYGQVVGGGKKGVFANHQPFAKSPEEAFKEAKGRQCPLVLCIPSRG
jgi:hypothetical protein